MARKSPQRPNADEPDARADETATSAGPAGADEAGDAAADDTSTNDAAADDDAAEASAAPVDRSSLWDETRVDPIEVALPSGVGYTLRAYRLSSELAPTDIEGREEDEDPFAGRAAVEDLDDEEVVILDEEFAALAAEGDDERGDRAVTKAAKGDEAGADEDETDEGGSAAERHADEEDDANVEEVPFFLSHRGRLLLFKSPESLVSFVRSGAPHDLAELDTWAELAERIQPGDVTAAEEDTYELDLVVENLRGGHDTWDVDLLIRAGEIARDLGYALRLPPVLTALSPGSPLDDLDDALRAAAGGGFGAFRGRRRLRRIGAQQASLGWRTIIGKISAAVDWRD